MNSMETSETRKNNPDSQATNALRISVVLAVVFVGTFGLYLYLLHQGRTWQYMVLAVVSGLVSLANISAIFLSRSNKTNLAVTLMIGSLAVLFPIVTALLSGVGLVLGIGGIIGIFMIAALTLDQPNLNRALGTGLVLGVGIILLDIFYPSPRLDIPLIKIFIPAVAVAGIGVFTYFISHEFAGYPFRIKLITLFVFSGAFAISAVALSTSLVTRNELSQQVGLSVEQKANRIASEIAKELQTQAHLLLIEAPNYAEAASFANTSYSSSETSDQILADILKLDQEWVSSDGNSAIITRVLFSASATKLHDFQSNAPEHVELFITDKYGANIAATNRTSDYYQADEEWWQRSYNNGNGAVYIGQPEYDESSKTYAVIMAVPIYSDNQVAGILRSTLNVNDLLALLQEEKFGNTGEVSLRIDREYLLGDQNKLAASELPALDSVMNTYGEITYHGVPSLASQAPLKISDNTDLTQQAISKLGWTVIVHQDAVEAFQPVAIQVKIITLIALGVLALAAILGYFSSQWVLTPIVNLNNTAGLIASGDLSQRSAISTNDEIGTLARTFNTMTAQLQDTLGGLERRVSERTADLNMASLLSERRAQELQAISEISRAISTEQRLEILLPLITRLVSERFDFYHAGIFFVDETRRFAFLQAANSEGGQRMLANGHRLEMGKGLVGVAAQTGKTRIALDVGVDAAYFDNPDLPRTRSEMALPLNYRGETIGVLDVQSTKPGAFAESDANTLGVLADQVAIAIENARLFGQTHQAREEAEALYSQILRQEWKAFSEQEEKIGYRQTATGGRALSTLVETDEIQRALKDGQSVVIQANGSRAQPTITVPVRLRGETIGILNIKAPSVNRKWNQDEVNLAQAISDRLALALDNVRLLQESQRLAAKEAKIGEVTAKIGASINMRNVLQTAVEELGRALPGSEVIIQFESGNDAD